LPWLNPSLEQRDYNTLKWGENQALMSGKKGAALRTGWGNVGIMLYKTGLETRTVCLVCFLHQANRLSLCTTLSSQLTRRQSMRDFEEAKMAKSVYQAELLSRPNVVGLGVGYKTRGSRVLDELSLVVLVRNKLPPVSLKPQEMIPAEVAGVRTDVLEVGVLRPLISHTERVRPAPGGVSIGHFQITAGTLGCVVRDRKSGERLILSNNHVLADRNAGRPGDPILQPGPADGGTPERDTIALLERFETLYYNEEPPTCSLAKTYAQLGNTLARWTGSNHQVQAVQLRPLATNQIDAALARPIADGEVLDEILEIGAVSDVGEAELGMQVIKSGRTTAFTSGAINVLDATVTVNYGDERTATFEHQIVSTPMSQGGDSGSLLVADAGKLAVGLLYAGSNQATLFNPIQTVFKRLNVELDQPGEKALNHRQSALEKAQAVKAAHEAELLAMPNVVGVGVGLQHKQGRRTDEIGLVVLVDHKLPIALLKPEERLPEEIDGVPVDVKEVGQMRADELSGAA
jgi:hypothetical protein